MKNMNVSLKICLAFLVVVLLTNLLVVFSIISMGQINATTQSIYYEVVQATDYISMIRENIQEQRVLAQNLYFVEGDNAKTANVIDQIEINFEEMRRYFSEYRENILNLEDAYNAAIIESENLQRFDDFVDLYSNYFQPEIQAIIASAGALDAARVERFIADERVTRMSTLANDAFAFYTELSKDNMIEADSLYQNNQYILWAIAAVTFIISCTFALYIPITVARPLRRLVGVANAVAIGDMDEKIDLGNRDDEVGKLARAFGRMQDEISRQIEVVESLANADLTVEPHLRSDKDSLGKALLKLQKNLDDIISSVTVAADSVARESNDVATESQELAQGTTEQATSVEQLSSAFFEISLNTKENATLAGKAATVSDEVHQRAIDGADMMSKMTEAVTEAEQASKRIDKIIKTIEEISFQTNILALNAAVEAAHAGQNGAGFAVVAAEVRSLASKSAEASKETGELIATALSKVQLCADIASTTSTSFSQIVEGIKESTKLVNDMAKSSEEQALAIEQINTGISQVAQVIHINSGAAEKCAASAEKLSNQSKALDDTVALFKTKKERHGSTADSLSLDLAGDPENQEQQGIQINLLPSMPDDNFGKY